jgi:hypothetical protein
VADFNQVIAARGGHGVVNFEVENEGCDMNNFAYVVAPAVLPFFPRVQQNHIQGKNCTRNRQITPSAKPQYKAN